MQHYRFLDLSKEEYELISILRNADLTNMALALIPLGISALAEGRSQLNSMYQEILADFNRARTDYELDQASQILSPHESHLDLFPRANISR